MDAFDLRHWPNRVVAGLDATTQLNGLAADLGVARALVICGRSVAGGPVLAAVRAGLGSRLACVFDGVLPQNPVSCIRAAADLARANQADGLISVGGGSAIDAAKCVALWLATAGDLEPYRIQHGAAVASKRALHAPTLPHIALPTTAGSSSEVMPTAGCRDPDRGEKWLFWDARLVPQLVVLDPRMATHTPPALTASSGMTAMARCIESLYSKQRQPITGALALRGAQLLVRSLPRAITTPGDLDARAECQIGCLMSGVAAINAMVSVVHAIGHVLGGRFGLQHGVGHAVLLAPAMRMLLPCIGAEQREVAEALLGTAPTADDDTAGQLAADAITALVAQLPLPQRLRDAGIREQDFAAIAAGAMDSYMLPNAPRAVLAANLRDVLRAAW